MSEQQTLNPTDVSLRSALINSYRLWDVPGPRECIHTHTHTHTHIYSHTHMCACAHIHPHTPQQGMSIELDSWKRPWKPCDPNASPCRRNSCPPCDLPQRHRAAQKQSQGRLHFQTAAFGFPLNEWQEKMRTEAPEEALVCVNLDIKSIKKKKKQKGSKSLLISTSSKKTKRKERGENHYSLTRLQQWKGGDKGEQRKQVINVLKGPLGGKARSLPKS